MTEVKLVGNNNTKVKVTNKEELLVKIGDIDDDLDLATQTTLEEIHNQLPSSLGQKVETESLSVVIASDQSNRNIVPNLLRTTTSGSIAVAVFSFSVANVGTANGTILGQTIKPKETFNFDAGAFNQYAANTISYNGTSTELIIIYNSL
jgi:hypothetical protein